MDRACDAPRAAPIDIYTEKLITSQIEPIKQSIPQENNQTPRNQQYCNQEALDR